jgi:hypothetical protein
LIYLGTFTQQGFFQMALYYFDLKDGTRLRDNSGTSFASDAEATSHAEVMAADYIAEHGPDAEGYINVIHQEGRVVGRSALLAK